MNYEYSKCVQVFRDTLYIKLPGCNVSRVLFISRNLQEY
jgi:hypothetical protein